MVWNFIFNFFLIGLDLNLSVSGSIFSLNGYEISIKILRLFAGIFRLKFLSHTIYNNYLAKFLEVFDTLEISVKNNFTEAVAYNR